MCTTLKSVKSGEIKGKIGINTVCKEKMGKNDKIQPFWEDVLEGLGAENYFARLGDVTCVSNMSEGLRKVQIYGLYDILNLSKSYTSDHEKGS